MNSYSMTDHLLKSGEDCPYQLLIGEPHFSPAEIYPSSNAPSIPSLQPLLFFEGTVTPCSLLVIDFFAPGIS